MRFDLKKPCLNCPFRSDATGIRFSSRERAEEIEESAYRHGFPCHQSAASTEDDDEDGGFVFAANGRTQHCIGALMVHINDGFDSTPGTGNNAELFERLRDRLDWTAPVFEDVEAFVAASPDKRPSPT